MSEFALVVSGISKQYRYGYNAPYRTLRDDLMAILRRPLRWLTKSAVRPSDWFWALDDVSFKVKHGEVLGIVGRNGAGKTTLLKVLSRITPPTRGRALVEGRIGSLLEVGTGFHIELSGRENIFLSGAILGMRHAEIARKFDTIVAYSELEKFLDTPLKHYSAGMYMRLAFAVAAHLDQEILLVDEVLAVGDVQFQQKCLGTMRQIGKSGRTVLFVSHNLGAVQSLCTRALLLDHGKCVLDDEPLKAIAHYLRELAPSASFSRTLSAAAEIQITAGKLELEKNAEGERVLLALEIQAQSASTVRLMLVLYDATGVPVGAGVFPAWDRPEGLRLKSGTNSMKLSMPTGLLAGGSYTISLALTFSNLDLCDQAERCLAFDVLRPSPYESLKYFNPDFCRGSILLPLTCVD